MIIVDEVFNNISDKKTYIALGNFDGIHLGHLTLINKAIELANKNLCYSMVYTFKNHPLSLIKEALKPKLLIDIKSKIKILQDMNIDILSFINFDKNFMEILPENFIKILLNKYNVKGIIVGFNYRFGYKNLGDINLLKELSEKYNFELIVMDACKFKNEVISSTRIRKELLKGNIIDSNYMLSRSYFLKGIVVKGKQIGRTIGFPTANLEISKDYLIPKIGVYYTNVELNGEIFKGITSIGNNPTVNGEKLTIETYILNFDKNIYNNELKLYFLERIRDEQKFNSVDELKLQLNKDKNVAKAREIMINI